MPKTADYTYTDDDGGVYHVRFYEAPDCLPLFIVSELPENESTSVTNLAEFLAAELRQKHMLGRYDDRAFIWVEHYPRPADEPRLRIAESWAFVSFASYEITQAPTYGSRWRPRLGAPGWVHVDIGMVAKLVEAYGAVLEEACTLSS